MRPPMRRRLALLIDVSEERTKIKLDGVQLVSGALTAVTSAVLLSTVGVAGTLIGAAVGSVLGTVGNAVYSYYLRLSRRRVATAKAVAEARVRGAASLAAQAGTHGDADLAEAQLEMAEEEFEQAQDDLENADEHKRVPWRDVVAALPWRRVLAVAGVVFVIAFGAILTFEAIAGRAVSTYTGGTDGPARVSIPGVGGGDSRDQEPDDNAPKPPDEEQPTAPSPSPTPTSAEPTTDPSLEPTPEETPSTEPSATPAPETPTP